MLVMKYFYYLCLTLILVWSCASKNTITKKVNKDNKSIVRIANDSLKYEINIIDYDYNKHYGLEVNYKLYNYFKFVEKEYGEKF